MSSLHHRKQFKGPLRSNVAITNLFHSSLLYAMSIWALSWIITLRSFMNESLRLVLGLTRGLLPLISATIACLIIWPSALHTCPNHSSILLLVYERIFGLLYSSCNSLLCLLSNCSVYLLYRGPFIFLKIFLSKVIRL